MVDLSMKITQSATSKLYHHCSHNEEIELAVLLLDEMVRETRGVESGIQEPGSHVYLSHYGKGEPNQHFPKWNPGRVGKRLGMENKKME